MNSTTIVILFVGLFLLGGVISFWKQKLPKSIIVLLALGSAFCLVTGAMRMS